MPVLRRTHGRHRDLRALAPATRTAARHRSGRDDHVMARHDSASPRSESRVLPATRLLAQATRPIAPTTISSPDPRHHPRGAPPRPATFQPGDARPASRCARHTTGRNRNPHRSPSAARGFLLWRISFACPHPISLIHAALSCQSATGPLAAHPRMAEAVRSNAPNNSPFTSRAKSIAAAIRMRLRVRHVRREQKCHASIFHTMNCRT